MQLSFKKYPKGLFHFLHLNKLDIQFLYVDAFQVEIGDDHLFKAEFFGFQDSLFYAIDGPYLTR